MPAPSLRYYAEFEEILTNYRISERAAQVLKDLPFVMLLAASSSGRNTVIRELVKNYDYYYIVSDTTRPPRVNDGVLEQNGVEYFFRGEEEMLEDLKKGEFLEAELLHGQQVSGISIRELEKAKNSAKIAITDMDIKGVNNILRVKPDAIAILLLPPSFEEWQRRILSRGRMSDAEYRRRLETAAKIFDDGLAKDYYRIVIADDVKHSAALIDALAHGGAGTQEARGRDILGKLQYHLQQKFEAMKQV